MNSSPKLLASEIGEFIRFASCQRRFKLAYNNRELAKKLPFVGRLFRSMDPILQMAGRQREEEWEKSLELQRCFVKLNNSCHERESSQQTRLDETLTWKDFQAACLHLTEGTNAYAREVQVSGEIGEFQVEGRVDFALVLWREKSSGEGPAMLSPILRLVECKASRRDRTYHRVQLAIYKMIVEQHLQSEPLHVGDHVITAEQLEFVVARIDEDTNRAQSMVELPPIDLSMISRDTLRLLSSDGNLPRILETELSELPYQLDSKCDDCVFNVNCFPESSRLKRLELLGCDPSTVRCLQQAGLRDIEQLAELDLQGDQAARIIQSGNCSVHIDVLTEKAAVRASALPNSTQQRFPVQLISVRTLSQLPPHRNKQGDALIRVYMAIDYDYSENRLGALTAHITASDGILDTPFEKDADGKLKPTPKMQEKKLLRIENNYKHVYDEGGHSLSGDDVLHMRETPWTGNYQQDALAEQRMVERFFADIVSAIKRQAGEHEQISVHFYVWSRLEIAHLVEACSRAGSALTGHLRELLGCREPLEQMIYSCVQDELNARYGLAWTGRGLIVATSVPWFGMRYHWNRMIDGVPTKLNEVFMQNLFDFAGWLSVDEHGEWVEESVESSMPHRFEIRSRFNDSLPAPYWHAVWGTLSDTNLRGNVLPTLKGFIKAGTPGLLKEYLRSRVFALRWVEERIEPKNGAILKSQVPVSSLPSFTLKVDSAARAAVDFLRLDHHIKMNDWTASQLVPPKLRITAGRTIPLQDVRPIGVNLLKGRIDLTGFDITLEDLRASCTIGEGAFVRMSPCQSDPSVAQSINQLFRGGSTCSVKSIDWQTREVVLSAIPLNKADRYRLMSLAHRPYSEGYNHATLDENPSSFVDFRVDKRLVASKDHDICRWFDRLNPTIPALQINDNEVHRNVSSLLKAFRTKHGTELAEDQKNAVLSGLMSSVQLLQGPPGTGKTMTTAVAVLARVLCRSNSGNCVLLAANTHTAVDTLLSRVQELRESFFDLAKPHGFEPPRVFVAKVRSSDIDHVGYPIELIAADDQGLARLHSARSNGVAIVGGTTASLLKLAEKTSGFQANMLIVDEASMMVFPHFLALATLINPVKATFMLAGDHRQLAPIVAHDWEREDRPPAVLYQPYASAYQAVRHLCDTIGDATRVSRCALSYTYRLPEEIRQLVGSLYRLDGVDLQGASTKKSTPSEICDGPIAPRPRIIESKNAIVQSTELGTVGDVIDPPGHRSRDGQAASGFEENGESNGGLPWQKLQNHFQSIWNSDCGLFLIVHNERTSRKNNQLEATIIEQLLLSGTQLPPGSVAIITPHRAQRTLLQTSLSRFASTVDVIDTVERLQGGERPTVIFSATVSDPSAIAANVEFILDLNRSNVAFSRSQQRLIVICSEELLNFIPADLAQYEESLLWKSLRSLCTVESGCVQYMATTVRLMCPSAPN